MENPPMQRGRKRRPDGTQGAGVILTTGKKSGGRGESSLQRGENEEGEDWKSGDTKMSEGQIQNNFLGGRVSLYGDG